MTEHIDVREYLPKIEEKERLFVWNRRHDREAAAYRFSVVNRLSDEWFNEVNSMKSKAKDIPADLIDLYEDTYKMMLVIERCEQDILLGRKD